jgi:hypothetical protein
MSFISITPSALPGEAAIVALCNLVEELAQGQSPEQKQILWTRYIELSAPFHALNVAIAQHIGQFLEKVLKIDITQVEPKP